MKVMPTLPGTAPGSPAGESTAPADGFAAMLAAVLTAPVEPPAWPAPVAVEETADGDDDLDDAAPSEEDAAAAAIPALVIEAVPSPASQQPATVSTAVAVAPAGVPITDAQQPEGAEPVPGAPAPVVSNDAAGAEIAIPVPTVDSTAIAPATGGTLSPSTPGAVPSNDAADLGPVPELAALPAEVRSDLVRPDLPATDAASADTVMSDVPPPAPAAPASPSGPAPLALMSTVAADLGGRPAPAVPPTPVEQLHPVIARLATSEGEGVHRLTLRLHPEELGPVQVTVTVRDGAVQVSLTALDDAQALLQSGTPELRRMLEDAGLANVDVDVREGSDEHPRRQERERSGGTEPSAGLVPVRSGSGSASSTDPGSVDLRL